MTTYVIEPDIPTVSQFIEVILGHTVQVDVCPTSRIATFRVRHQGTEFCHLTESVIAESVSKLKAASGVSNVTTIFPNIYIDLNWDTLVPLLEHQLLLAETTPQYNEDVGICNLSCCCPNANKPLHLGHARNLAIGGALAKILSLEGLRVEMTSLFSDYGVHIARAVSAYLANQANKTPGELGIKGDHFVGQCYELGSQHEQTQEDKAEHGSEARLLQNYVAGDCEVRDIFRRVTGWAIEGICQTIDRFDAHFNRCFFESETLELCSEIVNNGLQSGLLERHEDGSVWVSGIPETDGAILIRSDGTPLYLLQAIAASIERYRAYDKTRIVRYLSILGKEQRQHFDRYLKVWEMLGLPEMLGRKAIYYGLVYDGNERMRSRMGTARTLDSILDELEYTLDNRHIGNDISAEMVPEISVGILKTYLLAHRLDQPIHFQWRELFGDNGTLYIRAVRLAQRASQAFSSKHLMAPDQTHRSNLIRTFCRLPIAVKSSIRQISPTPLITYLRSLCEIGTHYLGGNKMLCGMSQDCRLLLYTLDRVFFLLDLPVHPLIEGRTPSLGKG